MRNKHGEEIQRRREYYLAKAEHHEAESDRAYLEGRRLAEQVPLGQPILVDHHSAPRMRAHQARVQRLADKALEHQRKAEYYRQKAAAVGTGGISSADPDTVQKLKDKIAALERDREHMKAANKAWKMAVRMGVNDLPPDEVPEEAAREIAEKVGLPVGVFLLNAITWKPKYSWEKGPYSGWPLKNLGANIRRYQKRLADLERRQKEEAPTEPARIGEVEVKYDDGRILLVFPDKPSAEVRARLKKAAFRWAPSRSAWVRKDTDNARHAAQVLLRGLSDDGLI